MAYPGMGGGGRISHFLKVLLAVALHIQYEKIWFFVSLRPTFPKLKALPGLGGGFLVLSFHRSFMEIYITLPPHKIYKIM